MFCDLSAYISVHCIRFPIPRSGGRDLRASQHYPKEFGVAVAGFHKAVIDGTSSAAKTDACFHMISKKRNI